MKKIVDFVYQLIYNINIAREIKKGGKRNGLKN